MVPNPLIESSRGERLGIDWVWSALPTSIVESDLELLSQPERARAATFKAARRRLEYVAARAQLRRTLGAALGVAPSAVEIALDEFGKPQAPSGGLQFNLAHSAGGLLIGWGRRAIGVDLESAQRQPRRIDRVRIVAEVRDGLSVDLIVAFTLVEAATKALGRGVGALRGLRLDAVVGVDEVRLASPAGALINAARVPVPEAYAGAVAVPV